MPRWCDARGFDAAINAQPARARIELAARIDHGQIGAPAHVSAVDAKQPQVELALPLAGCAK